MRSDTPSTPVLILAGGQGQRMGGIDKAFALYQGRSLIEQALDVASSIGPVIVASSRSADRYRQMAVDTVADALPGFAGPMSGLLAGFEQHRTGLLLSMPVDLHGPGPKDLLALAQSAAESRRCAYAMCADRRQPLLAAWWVDADLITAARAELVDGRGAVHALQDAVNALPVDFILQSAAWTNVNRT